MAENLGTVDIKMMSFAEFRFKKMLCKSLFGDVFLDLIRAVERISGNDEGAF